MSYPLVKLNDIWIGTATTTPTYYKRTERFSFTKQNKTKPKNIDNAKQTVTRELNIEQNTLWWCILACLLLVPPQWCLKMTINTQFYFAYPFCMNEHEHFSSSTHFLVNASCLKFIKPTYTLAYIVNKEKGTEKKETTDVCTQFHWNKGIANNRNVLNVLKYICVKWNNKNKNERKTNKEKWVESTQAHSHDRSHNNAPCTFTRLERVWICSFDPCRVLYRIFSSK